VSSFTVCLSVYVQRAALTTPRPSDARSPAKDSLRAFQAWTPPPSQARVPFHESFLVALGVGRVGTPSGQACTASSGQT
jgi:hypothetical protein